MESRGLANTRLYYSMWTTLLRDSDEVNSCRLFRAPVLRGRTKDAWKGWRHAMRLILELKQEYQEGSFVNLSFFSILIARRGE